LEHSITVAACGAVKAGKTVVGAAEAKAAAKSLNDKKRKAQRDELITSPSAAPKRLSLRPSARSPEVN